MLSAPATWGLQQRIAVALVAVAAVLVAVVGLSAVLLVQVRDAQTRVTEDYFAAVTLSDAEFIRLVDAETAIRGYALTRDPDALGPLRLDADADVEVRIERLLAGDEDTLDALAVARGSAQEWTTTWARPVLADLEAGGTLEVAEVERGRLLFDQVREDFAVYVDTLVAGRDAAREDLRGRTEGLFVAVVVSAVTAAAVGLVLWVLLHRWVAVPVARLAEQARVVGGGDLHRRVAVEGPPEIAALAGDVDDMRRHLVEQIAAVEQARAEVAQGRARLEEQAEDLQRSNRELEQFAYVASHDLQEPLRKVASFTQMLQRRYAGQLDERADQYIDFAVDGAKRMQQLINDLLDFSRVGRVTVEQADVDLGVCAERALVALAAAVDESGAEVSWQDLPTVRGEAPLLTQLLQNLVGNAVKFRGDDPPRVHLSARRVGDEWEMACADNGIGIEPRYAERVFLVFQRLHSREVYEGTGIGLAMCRKIVEYHGGRIWVDEAPGAGTVIRWTLPATVPDRQDGTGGTAPPEGTAAEGIGAGEGARRG